VASPKAHGGKLQFAIEAAQKESSDIGDQCRVFLSALYGVSKVSIEPIPPKELQAAIAELMPWLNDV
jgi:hypothetical protein